MKTPFLRVVALLLAFSLGAEPLSAFPAGAGPAVMPAPAAGIRFSAEALTARPAAALYRSRAMSFSPRRFGEEIAHNPLFSPMGPGMDRVRYVTQAPKEPPFVVSFEIDTTKLAALIHMMPQTQFALLVAPITEMDDSSRARVDFLLEFPPLPLSSPKPQYLVLGHLDEPLFVVRRALLPTTPEESRMIERERQRANGTAEIIIQKEGFVERFDLWAIDREQYTLHYQALEALSEYLDDTFVVNVHVPDAPITADIDRGAIRTRFTLTTPHVPQGYVDKPKTRKSSKPRPYGHETIHAQGLLVALGLTLQDWMYVAIGFVATTLALYFFRREDASATVNEPTLHAPDIVADSPKWPYDVTLTEDMIPVLARTALRIAQHLADGGYETIVFSGRAARMTHALTRGAWQAIFPHTPFPPTVLFDGVENHALYKSSTSTPEERTLILRRKLGPNLNQKIALVEKVSITGEKFEALGRAYREAGYHNHAFAIFADHPTGKSRTENAVLDAFVSSTHPEVVHALYMLGMAVSNQHPRVMEQVNRILAILHELQIAMSALPVTDPEVQRVKSMKHAADFWVDVTNLERDVHKDPRTGITFALYPVQGMTAESTALFERMLGFPTLPQSSEAPRYFLAGKQDHPYLLFRHSLQQTTPAMEAVRQEALAHTRRTHPKHRFHMKPGFADVMDLILIGDPEDLPLAELIKSISVHFNVTMMFSEVQPETLPTLAFEQTPTRARFYFGSDQLPEPVSSSIYDKTLGIKADSKDGGHSVHTQGLLLALGLSLGSWPLIVAGLTAMVWMLGRTTSKSDGGIKGVFSGAQLVSLAYGVHVLFSRSWALTHDTFHLVLLPSILFWLMPQFLSDTETDELSYERFYSSLALAALTAGVVALMPPLPYALVLDIAAIIGVHTLFYSLSENLRKKLSYRLMIGSVYFSVGLAVLAATRPGIREMVRRLHNPLIVLGALSVAFGVAMALLVLILNFETLKKPFHLLRLRDARRFMARSREMNIPPVRIGRHFYQVQSRADLYRRIGAEFPQLVEGIDHRRFERMTPYLWESIQHQTPLPYPVSPIDPGTLESQVVTVHGTRYHLLGYVHGIDVQPMMQKEVLQVYSHAMESGAPFFMEEGLKEFHKLSNVIEIQDHAAIPSRVKLRWQFICAFHVILKAPIMTFYSAHLERTFKTNKYLDYLFDGTPGRVNRDRAVLMARAIFNHPTTSKDVYMMMGAGHVFDVARELMCLARNETEAPTAAPATRQTSIYAQGTVLALGLSLGAGPLILLGVGLLAWALAPAPWRHAIRKSFWDAGVLIVGSSLAFTSLMKSEWAISHDALHMGFPMGLGLWIISHTWSPHDLNANVHTLVRSLISQVSLTAGVLGLMPALSAPYALWADVSAILAIHVLMNGLSPRMRLGLFSLGTVSWFYYTIGAAIQTFTMRVDRLMISETHQPLFIIQNIAIASVIPLSAWLLLHLWRMGERLRHHRAQARVQAILHQAADHSVSHAQLGEPFFMAEDLPSLYQRLSTAFPSAFVHVNARSFERLAKSLWSVLERETPAPHPESPIAPSTTISQMVSLNGQRFHIIGIVHGIELYPQMITEVEQARLGALGLGAPLYVEQGFPSYYFLPDAIEIQDHRVVEWDRKGLALLIHLAAVGLLGPLSIYESHRLVRTFKAHTYLDIFSHPIWFTTMRNRALMMAQTIALERSGRTDVVLLVGAAHVFDVARELMRFELKRQPAETPRDQSSVALAHAA